MAPGPVRTVPEKSRKYSKSERTHEENQERAYIAASRRSDRSLEARMESARRASEIHRRRCGRAFRITEEAVLNEEMYEEEDPDYGQRVSRIYAALANDASFIHQQWLQSQRMRFDHTTGSFVVNPFAQNMGNPSQQSQEGLPFFAYQPGAQPTSTPIRQNSTSNPMENLGDNAISSPTPVSPTPQSANTFDFSRFQTDQAAQSPQPLSPQSNVGPMSPMFEDNPNPMAAQLNFFTYPTPDFSNFSMGYNYNPNLSQNPMAGSESQMPMSPTATQTQASQISNQFRSPVLERSGEQVQSPTETNPMAIGQSNQAAGNTALLLQQQLAYKKLASPYANMQAPDQQTLLEMQNKLMNAISTNPSSSNTSEPTPALKTEESGELPYEDWLCIPGSQG